MAAVTRTVSVVMAVISCMEDILAANAFDDLIRDTISSDILSRCRPPIDMLFLRPF